MKHLIIPPDPKNWTTHSAMFQKFTRKNLEEYIEVHHILLQQRADDDVEVKRIKNLLHLAEDELEKKKP